MVILFSKSGLLNSLSESGWVWVMVPRCLPNVIVCVCCNKLTINKLRLLLNAFYFAKLITSVVAAQCVLLCEINYI